MFTESHIYWTFHWNVNGVAEEFGQFGLRASTPGTPPTLTTVTNVVTELADIWDSTNLGIAPMYRLFRCKAALIQPDGHYDPGFDPVVVDITPVAGGLVTAPVIYPLQVAQSVQLTTDRDSGRAHAGRIYLPPLATALGANARWSSTPVNARGSAVAQALTEMEAQMGGEHFQVMSSLGAGTTRQVTGVRLDDRPDVQRRRARQQPYLWSSVFAV